MTAPVTAAAGTLMLRGWALVFQAKDIGGDSCLPLSSFFCIYCSKNREYGLDITSLECLRHITIDPQLRLSIPGSQVYAHAHVHGPRSHVSIPTIRACWAHTHTITTSFSTLFTMDPLQIQQIQATITNLQAEVQHTLLPDGQRNARLHLGRKPLGFGSYLIDSRQYIRGHVESGCVGGVCAHDARGHAFD